jgi:hypothetical protein
VEEPAPLYQQVDIGATEDAAHHDAEPDTRVVDNRHSQQSCQRSAELAARLSLHADSIARQA